MSASENLPTTLKLGPVHLTVTDLDASLSWYQRALGLRVMHRDDGYAELGDGATVAIVCHEHPEAEPQGHHAGLFHYCLMYSTREELARAVVRIGASGTEVTYKRDRGTHEAIYLPDPDGNPIELGWDRPREQWPEDPYGHTPKPLDEDSLLATIVGEAPRPYVEEGLWVGHVHLTVGDVDQAIEFYATALGFDLRYHVGVAAFFSVGGYHHQAAANVRAGTDVGPLPKNVRGFKYWTLELPAAGMVDEARNRLERSGHPTRAIDGGFAVSDPWEIPVEVISR